ncbi:MAG: AMP-binding protein [Myxococcales bacterium]|nr:AMP-binding protein [Myxococcales bacterium]
MKRLDTLRDNALATALMSRAAYYSMVKLREDSDLTPVRMVEHWAEQQPNGLAITGPEGSYSYRGLDAAANAAARALQALGMEKGQRLALMMASRPEFLVATLGAAKLGVACALLPPTLAGDALAHALRVIRPDYVLAGSECQAPFVALSDSSALPRGKRLVWIDEQGAAVDAPIPVGWEDFGKRVRDASGAPLPVSDGHDMRLPFVLLASGGPSELPRITLVTNQRFLQGCYYFGQAVIKSNPTDVAYNAGLPLAHRAAFYQAWGVALTGGGALALRRSFAPAAFWEDCDRYDVSLVAYLGATCRGLLRAPAHPKERSHRVRAWIGSGLEADVWGTFKERFAAQTVFENYIATGGHVGLINLSGHEGMVGRLGAGRGQVLARVDPVTEEFVREGGKLVPAGPGECGVLLAKIGPLMAFEGFEDPADNAASILVNPFGREERYVNTRDLMMLHEGQWVSFAPRMGDDVQLPGSTLSSADIEDRCAEVAGVRDACAYPVDVPTDAQPARAIMVALVVDAHFTLDSFAKHTQAQLPRAAWPRYVRLTSSIATTSSRRPLKSRFCAEGVDPGRGAAPTFELDAQLRYVPLGASPAAAATHESSPTVSD